MHLLARISFILLISGFVVCEEEVKSDEGVLVLTVKNFKQVIKEHEYILVEFCKYQVHPWPLKFSFHINIHPVR
jgi:hypothetical protein